MKLPTPRGPSSADLLTLLLLAPEDAEDALARVRESTSLALASTPDVVADEDLQLSLFCLNALHYGGVDNVPDGWEWHPHLAWVRAGLESAFETAVRTRVPVPDRPAGSDPQHVAAALFTLAAADTGASLSRFVERKATPSQLAEFLVQRSIYTLREADPHSWAIPRLSGPAQSALVEIQADEYGGGRPDRMHSLLFANSMRGMGLDTAYGAYLDHVPALTLASVNLMTLFGLHRRLRGALVGHLAVLEINSSVPNRRYGNAFRRVGRGELSDYFDEHVEADAVHEQIAARELAGGLVSQEPELLGDVLFGAAACLAMDGWAAEPILAAWQRGRSSLTRPLSTEAGLVPAAS